jgi:hypothetical protein
VKGEAPEERWVKDAGCDQQNFFHFPFALFNRSASGRFV